MVNKPVSVYLAVDSRRQKLSWIDNTWTNTKMTMTNNEATPSKFILFMKSFPTGQISLGANNTPTKGHSMYTIIVK